MKLPALRKVDITDHLPVSYDELRGKSYADWNDARKSIMERYFNSGEMPQGDYFLGESGCLSCDGQEYEHLFSKEGFNFVECSRCRLVQVNPRPRPELVDVFYNTEEYNRFVKAHMTQKTNYRKERFGTERVTAWESYTGNSSAELTLRSLDVGCGSGFVLEAARDRGWDAYGVDLNSQVVEIGREKGLNIYNSKLEDLSPKSFGKFDVLTMYDVLEHSYNPQAMIKAAKSMLVDGGLMVIYVPNWNSLARLVLGVETFWIWGIFHLSYFSIETLSELVSDNGFELLHYETQGMDVADIIWWYENRKKSDASVLRDHLETFQYGCNAAGLGAGVRLFARN
jgi:SAM-dependent methyltransferase